MKQTDITEHLTAAWRSRQKHRLSFRTFGTHWGGFQYCHMYGTLFDIMREEYERILGSMAKGRQEKKAFEFNGFVNHDFTAEEKVAFRAWQPDRSEQDGLVLDCVMNGYKFGATYDKHNQACVVSMTCRDQGSPNYGYTISARAGDLIMAERAVLYKHYSIFEQDWLNYEGGEVDLLA